VKDTVKNSKILFRNPAKNAVVIFDDNGSDLLRMAVLKNIESTIIYNRKEAYYVTVMLLFFMAKNILRFLVNSNQLSLQGANSGGLLFKIYKIYLFSCIDYIKPKVVLTFIDNSSIFHWLSRTYKSCAFYAVQNGSRNDAKRLHYRNQVDSDGNTSSRSVHYSTNVTSMPNLFSFGKYEVDLYKKHKQEVDNIYPVGALKGSYYKACIADSDAKVKFDICLISDQLLSFPKGHVMSKHDRGVAALHGLVQQYVAESQTSICIAMRSTNEQNQQVEADYFMNLFGHGAELFERYNAPWSTYRAMESSSIVIALNSTCAFEAFGWGNKVLFCNLSGDDFYQTPLPDICSMNQNEYTVFKNKLNSLRELNMNDYKERTEVQAQYIMNYDPEKPAHIKIREKILSHCISN
jgi:hypothetical protein